MLLPQREMSAALDRDLASKTAGAKGVEQDMKEDGVPAARSETVGGRQPIGVRRPNV